jgi:hypothetical protein
MEVRTTGSPSRHRKNLPRDPGYVPRLGGRVATIHSRRAAKEVNLLLASETTIGQVLPFSTGSRVQEQSLRRP